MNPINTDAGEAIAISALQFMAADDDLLMRFCAVTGILRNDIRENAAQPGFLVGVLDFFLSHEPDLIAWTESANINPENVMAARFALAPEDTTGFE